MLCFQKWTVLPVREAIRLENEQIPVLFLTAKNSSSDRVTGLKIGADDYLTKPFNLEELLLRIQVLLKRAQRSSEKSTPVISNYSFDNFLINFAEMNVFYSGWKEIKPDQKGEYPFKIAGRKEK